ncbi:MAG: hypothetical protein F6J94_22075 [Moorea sp. SIO1F2]|uniref:hypothetical protein n=1 Tax=Moorena sp. SIO1F2 TaxID=2607819 RepID=UPI0013BC86BF|nr:hypothetical protein [Moorena sp. SIO1F2]NEO61127.1 hypothetical protein [Moorena sp. SIO4G2]NET84507.1 hypothetical protein [Moorena sp. SIO1F2]
MAFGHATRTTLNFLTFNLKLPNLGLWPRYANNLLTFNLLTFNLQPSTFNL